MQRIGFFVVLAILATASAAAAQGPTTPSPLGLGQGENKNAPVQIEAGSIEVHDKTKTATFSGNVQVVQGDTTMKCHSLVVFYGQEVGIGGSDGDATAATPAKSNLGMPHGAQSVRRIEAHGGVTVLTKDQRASGNLGIYDLKTKTITLSGDVIVSQGQNIIHGERVVVDTETGNARVESGSGGAPGTSGAGPGRVRALIQPSKGQGAGPSNITTIGPGLPN